MMITRRTPFQVPPMRRDYVLIKITQFLLPSHQIHYFLWLLFFNFQMIQNQSSNRVSTRYSSRIFGQDITNITNNQLPDNRKISKKRKIKIQEPVSHIQISNVCETSHYLTDIHNYLRKEQPKSFMRDNYMPWHQQISERFREILIGWIVGSQVKLNLKSETIYKTVFIIDRFCYTRCITFQKYHLLGLSALFLSAKYQEIKTPKIKSYIEMANNLFTKENILEMESQILLALRFQVDHSSSYFHLEKNMDSFVLDVSEKKMCYQLLDMTLIEYKFCMSRPSLLSMTIIMYVLWISKKEDYTNQKIEKNLKLSKITHEELSYLLKAVDVMHRSKSDQKFESVYLKYETNKLN